MNRILQPFAIPLQKLHQGKDSSLPKWSRRILHLVSIVYGKVAEKRRIRYDRQTHRQKRLPCPVISIGNITLGGTGKSPTAVYVARMLWGMGFHPAILSRGYRGSAEKTGAVVSNGRRILLSAAFAGDEPVMMAHHLPDVPVLVGKNRFQSGLRAIQTLGCDVVILDDGFQHLGLFRDIDLVLLDCSRPFGNGCLFPEGPLREPVSAMRAADAVLYTRCLSDLPNRIPEPGIPPGIPVFCSRHHTVLRAVWPAGFSRKQQLSWFSCFSRPEHQPGFAPEADRIFVFSGIARNADFRESLQHMGGRIVEYLEFPDHHPYDREDARQILDKAGICHAHSIVTTEKDACRLAGLMEWPYPMGIAGVDIALSPVDSRAFFDFFRLHLGRSKSESTRFGGKNA